MTWLLIYVFFLSLYDLRTRRIPNWATIPLILAGLVAHFPGYSEMWFASIGLYLAWASGWMGADDAKLWIALLWALPMECLAQTKFSAHERVFCVNDVRSIQSDQLVSLRYREGIPAGRYNISLKNKQPPSG